MGKMDLPAWLDLLRQESRFITLESEAANGLIVERLDGREGINEDFHFTLDCVSASAFVRLEPLLGQPLRLGLARADGLRRRWHGYVVCAASLGSDGGLARYRLIVQSALAFLGTRRNTLIFQDKTALEVIAQVFDDYSQLAWRDDTTAQLRRRPTCTQRRETDLEFVRRLLGEEGLSWRIEHDQNGDSDGPGHTVVIFDSEASQSLPTGEPARLRFHRIDATEREDAISFFSPQRLQAPDQTSTASWAADQVQGIAGEAHAKANDESPELPALEVFEADRAQRFDNTEQARYYARHRLDAARLPTRRFQGRGAVRTLEAGKRYTLTEHPDLSGLEFVPLWVQHVATNNLSANLPHSLGRHDNEALGKGSYRQRFTAIAAGTAIAPLHQDKPLAPGCDNAIVTGRPDEALTGTRDHQVRIQSFWQRGLAPLSGGLTDTASARNPDGHAPGDEHAGTWVRVAETHAGAHHGASFVPRIGNEVLVAFAHADADQPVVVGQLYNGRAAPPFAAGQDSSANHPGTLSGIQTQSLEGEPSATWIMDDASGQLRLHLSHALGQSALTLGYLINQSANMRAGYRGEGFELATQGWLTVRSGEGLLVSATARPQGQSTQIDSTEVLGQIRPAAITAEHMSNAAREAQARDLSATAPVYPRLQQIIDPAQDGKYPGTVNGQSATRPQGGERSGGAPVEHFAEPAVMMESPESVALTTPGSMTVFAGGHHHLTSQRDTQLSAGATIAAVSGNAAGLHAAAGGLKVIANHGPVSLEAHDDPLQILAAQSATVTSTSDRIDVLAKDRITLQVGASTITLDGANLTLACPGQFIVRTGAHAWMGGDAQAAMPGPLPRAQVSFPSLHRGSPAASESRGGGGASGRISVLPVSEQARYDQGFVASWGETGIPAGRVCYTLKNASGGIIAQGRTSEAGETERSRSHAPDGLSVELWEGDDDAQ